MKKFIIQEDLANVLIQYIATKPYMEVNQLVVGLQNLEEFKGTEEGVKNNLKENG